MPKTCFLQVLGSDKADGLPRKHETVARPRRRAVAINKLHCLSTIQRMNHFTPLQNFIHEKFHHSEKSVSLFGLEESQWFFIQNQMALSPSSAHQLFVFDSQEKAEYYHDQLKEVLGGRVFLYPGLDASPYNGHVLSDFSLFERFRVLSVISAEREKTFVFTSFEASCLLMPKKDFFSHHRVELSTSDIISPQDLAKQLVDLGYRPTTSSEEMGTFSQKGEIVDLYPINGIPVRIYYFDDMIEEIFAIDRETQRTKRQHSFEKITLDPAPHIFSSPPFPTTLRGHIPRFKHNQKVKGKEREYIFSRLSQGNLFESYSVYCPLFLSEQSTLWSYFDWDQDLIHLFNTDECDRKFTALIDELREEHEKVSTDDENACILPEPARFYDLSEKAQLKKFKTIEVNHFSTSVDFQEKSNILNLALEPAIIYLKKTYPDIFQEQTNPRSVIRSLLSCSEQNKKIIIVFSRKSAKKEIEHFLKEISNSPNIPTNIEFFPGFLEKGFHYFQGNLLILSESDIFNIKRKKTSSKRRVKNADLFAEQMKSLKVDDYVVHKNLGVGIYKGLQTLDIGGNKNDFIIIHYQDDDKVYVPVYKIDLVQKYADGPSKTKVANLKSNKFKKIKRRAKESAKKLAFDLLKIQASRENHQSHRFSPPDDLYREFELKCPFRETVDQNAAIEDALGDMQSSKPMDRLICGDVGFGKTEVAMRAAFKALEDEMQVAIIVPTTILALQHYHSFQKRFQDFPIEIDFLSRFKSPKEANEVMEKVKLGQIDILIGTHKLLSNKLTFKNLGLLIIDEEQRFGVSHKEKLKSIKASVDVLTLTATPIPRTLQLAFLGIRDLSLIQTAPPKRQSIKTYIIKHDDETIKKAIENELKRGGQIFFIHNRVRDIQEVLNYIKELVPQVKVISAHGQMPEKELERRMSDFYNHKYDLLLSTTIIESGLDIPSANTMIINQANTYGLAQLHQLRGRIGRSERKAYAYFIIPNDRKISTLASQRLQALQTYTDIGSGFSLATSDLEIRGAGDILGAEQSGHIEAVGLESYMELLKEAIAELTGNQKAPIQDIEIQTPFSCLIPNSYITDPRERLKTYKRLSNAEETDSLEMMRTELQDRFGPIPSELHQLFELLSIRLVLGPMGIEKAKVAGKVIELKFSEEYLSHKPEYRDKIINFFVSRPRKYQLGQHSSVTRVFSSPVTLENFSQFARDIAHQFVLC